MKKPVSLRTRMTGLMALLVLLQSLSLFSSLSISDVFSMLDSEAFRLFSSTTTARVQEFDNSVATLVSNMTVEAKTLNNNLNSLAAASDVSAGALYIDDALYHDLVECASESIIRILAGNNVSGAFVIMNGSNANKSDTGRRSSVYITNSAQTGAGESVSNYVLEIGPISVSQHFGIASSVRWNLDIAVEEDSNYFDMPIKAATDQKGAEISRYGYWTAQSDILADGRSEVLYTLPLIDANGDAYGVFGFEISTSYFNQYYLPNTNLPYQNSMLAIVPHSEDSVVLDWYIPSGPIAQVYLSQGDRLELSEVSVTDFDLYKTEISELGEMYCMLSPLKIYSGNSPFYAESWSLVSFVPVKSVHDTSSSVRSVLIASIVLTTGVAFIAIFILVYGTTTKITGLSSYVRSLSPFMDINFKKTGIREIDDLTAAVEMLNRSAVNASKTTSKILEMTLLPIGGYEVSEEQNYVVVTEYVRQLLSLPMEAQISKEKWRELYAGLVAEKAAGYEDIYKVEFQEDNLKWLRIIQTRTDTGTVGVILDVTKDIAEHRRLAHELDYDALTHLYNRMAFKREAHLRIQGNPDHIGVMIFSDLDSLKYINDTFGHDMGDRLIIRAGEMFRTFEQYGGIVSRISGDEFAIYLHGFDSIDEARDLVFSRYRENDAYSLATPDGQIQKIRYSSGLAFYPQDSDNVTDLLKLADFAMYEAKHNRKGSINVFNLETYRTKSYLLDNREAINRLLDDSLIRFAFQPIVDLKTGEIYGYEALMRPLLDNFNSPTEILNVAATQSKLGQLERLVIMKAFAYVKEHLDELGGIMIFVNSIPSQVLSDADHEYLLEHFSEVLKYTVIEITEAENDNPEVMKKKINFLQRHNISIAIDDFGSGHSNELRILSINPSVIKIDIELISNIDLNADKQMLVSNLVSFCHPKGIKLVAEGVETREELEMVEKLGVDYVQGYYLQGPEFEFVDIPEDIKGEIRSFGAEGCN